MTEFFLHVCFVPKSFSLHLFICSNRWWHLYRLLFLCDVSKKKKKKDFAREPLFPSNNAVFQSNMCSFSPHATENTDIETEPLTFVLCHMLCFLHDSPSFSAILRLNVYMFSKCQRSLLCCAGWIEKLPTRWLWAKCEILWTGALIRVRDTKLLLWILLTGGWATKWTWGREPPGDLQRMACRCHSQIKGLFTEPGEGDYICVIYVWHSRCWWKANAVFFCLGMQSESIPVAIWMAFGASL